MWEPGKHCTKSEKNINDELLEIKGELDDVKAQITFAKFLRYNPSFACQILFGIELYEIQDIILRSTWKRDFVLNILSRGFGKSFLAGVFIGLYAIFNPGVKIGICSRSFRQSKIIFKNLEDLSRSHKGRFFEQCINKPVHGPDAWEMTFINGSKIVCLPLGDGCLTEDTSILLSDGFYNISELLPDSLEINKPIILNKKIASLDNFENAEELYYTGDKEVFKLVTHKGYEVQATNNHQFKILNENGVIWKRLEDISINDIILINKTNRDINGESININQSYTLGAMIGDGCYTNKYRLGFASADSEIINIIKSCFEKQWEHYDKYHYTIHGEKIVSDWLNFWGLEPTLTKHKKLPDRILKSNKDCLKACLQGLFDTDGHVQRDSGNSVSVGFSNTSRELVRQIHKILLTFGITSFLKTRDRTKEDRQKEICYELIITGNSAKKFAKEINFNLLRKRDALNNSIKNQSKNIDYDECFPHFVIDKILNFIKEAKKKGRKPTCLTPSYLKRIKNISPKVVKIFLDFYKDCITKDLKSFLSSILDENILYDTVISKDSEGIKKVFDISVPKTNEFWANGFCAHNSKIRGYRFDVMVIDELLLLSDQTVNEVIRPFLVVNSDPKAKYNIEQAIKVLKENNEITEDDIKTIMPVGKKLIGLSSASYKFEYLYKLFDSYVQKILSEPSKDVDERVSHAIFQLSHKAAPPGLMNPQQINEARATMSAAQFARELESQFTDDSSGFFSAQKMKEATVPDGMKPCTRITGDPDKKYILAIDPNYNDSETSDHFAMAVTELDEVGRTGTLVHAYALSKSNIAARARYIAYLLKNFNIVFIILDNAGGNKFIGDINESSELKEMGINLKFLDDIDFMAGDYTDEIQKAKNQYNQTINKICYSQLFEGQWIRIANEHLQGCIENKRIMFASNPAEDDFYLQMKARIPIESLEFADEMAENKNERLRELIEHQSFLMNLTKTECALIEVATSPQGKQTFDLPRNLKGSTSPERSRKDSYTVLMLNNWAIKCYFDMVGAEVKKRESFVPFTFS